MYRISVTSLEAFRRFRDKHSVWDTEERLLNVLSGKKEPNSYATIGSCFHKIVETGKATYIGNGIFEQEEDGVIVRLNSKAVENAIITGISIRESTKCMEEKIFIRLCLIFMCMDMPI